MLRILYQSRTMLHRASPGLFYKLAMMLDEGLVRNPPCGVTSVLAFHDHRFAQVIEGPDAGVLALFERVSQDERHDDVQIMLFETVDRRLFAGWAMAFLGIENGLGPIFADLDRDPSAASARGIVADFAAMVN